MSKEKKPRWRFWRSQLATIVWDKDKDVALADFTPGHFTTDDPDVARKLHNLGYPQIPLDAVEPPPDVIIRPPAHVIEGDVPVFKGYASESVIDQRVNQKMRTVPASTAADIQMVADGSFAPIPPAGTAEENTAGKADKSPEPKSDKKTASKKSVVSKKKQAAPKKLKTRRQKKSGD